MPALQDPLIAPEVAEIDLIQTDVEKGDFEARSPGLIHEFYFTVAAHRGFDDVALATSDIGLPLL